MKNVSIVISLLLSSLGNIQGQTHLISHKSHSGKTSHFKIALKKNSSISDFGEAPNPFVRRALLDSLIYVDDTTAVMITTETCFNRFEKDSDTTVWKEGTDTVYHHPLFHLKHDLDSVKDKLKNRYHFKNDVEEVVFIGYDNGESLLSKKEKRKKKKKEKKVLKKKKAEQKEIEKKNKEKTESEERKKSDYSFIPSEIPPPPPSSPNMNFIILFMITLSGILAYIHHRLKLAG